MESADSQQAINVTMLGKFEISIGNTVITKSSNRTHQLWSLVEYLIAFRNKTISQEELINMLWPDDNSDNPANALKNLVYRVRNVFSAQGIPFAKELIVFNRGTYHWNNELKCYVDIEMFEQFYRRCSESFISAREQLEASVSAIMLYNDDFLPDSNSEAWVVPLVSYYRSVYFKCVRIACELLTTENRFDEIVTICQKAILIDSYEELPHKYLILSFAKQNKHLAALNHYRYVTDAFYRELGVKPSEEMRGLYREINKSINNVEMDLEIIKEDLAEHSKSNDAYYCDYEVFKNLYRVESRTATRTGQAVFIGLLTITDTRDQVPSLQAIGAVMEKLLRCVKKSLRRGDIVSRFSSTQYVLMFPSLLAGSGNTVINRISNNFAKEFTVKGIKLHATIKAIDF